MQSELLDELRAAHRRAAMVGWDFTQLDSQVSSDKPWWNFERDCLHAMREARSVCDIGTGGGERLLGLVEAVREDRGAVPQITATEGWAPNVAVARRNFEDVGIPVHSYKTEFDPVMPFLDAALDLVMSRHEAIDAAEVSRILKPGGKLLTQQVHGQDTPELREWFGVDSFNENVNSETYVENLTRAGLEVNQVDDWSGIMRFRDVQSLVTYLGFIPWIVPDFDVEKYFTVLHELNKRDSIDVTQRRFRVYAKKKYVDVA